MNKKIVGMFFLGAAMCWSLNSHANYNSKYYEIGSVKVSEVTDQYPQINTMDEMLNNCSSQNILSLDKDGSLPGLDQVEVWIDQIINIGKKIWKLVLMGKPVVNLKFDTANALPKGTKCWTELQGWSVPQSKVYQVTYSNRLGMTVVNFAYRVSFISGGNYQGKGKYITTATVQPAHLDVKWGYKFDAEAEVPVVFNQGTSQEPVAGMQLNINWKVNTAVAHSQQTESFFMNGNGEFTKMQ